MSKAVLVENLMAFLPNLHKKLFKGVPPFEISRQQAELLFFVFKENGMPMSYYSDKTMVSKPSLTLMADKLIEEDFIERGFDKDDRRVITLNITQKGIDCVNRQREKIKETVILRLEVLSENEVTRLNALFDEINQIFDKLNI